MRIDRPAPGAPTSRSPHAGQAIVIVGMECRVPGAADVRAFEQLLFAGQSGIAELPAERLDRSLYFDPRKGEPGKTYTTLGGLVPPAPPDLALLGLDKTQADLFDPVHLRFCEVAIRAWRSAGLQPRDPAWRRTGVFVGHSGATQHGGDVNLSTHLPEGLDFLNDSPAFAQRPAAERQQVLAEVLQRLRGRRRERPADRPLRLNGYSAAALPALRLGLEGPRSVCDAACASSLFSLQQAILALQLGRIDAALVGGATTNGVDNLILFSQSQACSAEGSRPFDQGASGLISSEGYAALVVMRHATAMQHGLPVLGVISGLGTASDGRGKSLWAPRAEGQQLALRRAYADSAPLPIDYLEAHATSTQLGDATELHAVQQVLSAGRRSAPLLMGSVKSNLGHTLETAGVVGLIKVLLAMRRGELPPSLNFQQPNQNFDWNAGAIQIVDRVRTWTPSYGARRAAVSAFGIGGLNAHVFVEEPAALARAAAPAVPAQRDRNEPIAIVGRGVVLPGAKNLPEFSKLLASGASLIGPPPAERWRRDIGVSPLGTAREKYSAPTNNGGYIRDYAFDGQVFRIPPKQVKQANPVQMMLLDAVSQAAREFDGGAWSLDKQRTGVVIGAVFGGEFGTQLQLGLRLPEIVRELSQALRKRGWSEEDIAALCEDYRKRVLAARPALLDETGSFTASTLASRVAKTFDLMGGACALDVDNASGLAGLNLACDQLRAGNWDAAICGSGDRSMDLALFERLDLQGRLVRSGRPDDIPPDCRQILPGEGVVALLLKRLGDAQAAGDAIFGIIDDVGPVPAGEASAPAQEDRELARQIGYLTGAQSLVRLVKSTLEWEQNRTAWQSILHPVRIENQTEDGLTYCLEGRPPGMAPAQASGPSRGEIPAEELPRRATEEIDRSRRLSFVESNPEPAGASGSPHGAALRAVRLSGTRPEELRASIETVLSRPELAYAGASHFTPDKPCRLTVLAESPRQLAERLSAVRKQLDKGRRCGVLETERAILWEARPGAGRVAWAFPGQGSQYAESPAALDESEAVRRRLAEIDALLQAQGLAPLTPQLEQEGGAQQFGDIWWNQLWVLGTSLALTAELDARGWRPDVVLGHSFGEYAALAAAGAVTAEQLVRMVKARADAVTMTVREPGRLISVRGAPHAVEAVLRSAGVRAQITHYNSPQQTVIAAAAQDVEAVRKHLTSAGLASMIVPVPVAYHTPRLADAEEILDRTFAREPFRPARCGFLSTTSVRYLAEPADLCDSLVTQLTRPVLYVPCLERLIADGVSLMIEVGPNQVLSRLNQELAGEQALCLSLDVPGRAHAERLLLVQAALEMIAPAPAATPILVSSIPATREPAAPIMRSAADDVEVVDVRRSSQRNGTRKDIMPAAPAPVVASASVAPPTQTPRAPTSAPAGKSAAAEEEIRTFLRNVVVDLTGYSPDVVDFEADLEADLGVDSIKKAQVVGEVAEVFGLTAAPEGMKLGDLRTLGDIAALAVRAGGASPPQTSDIEEHPAIAPVEVVAAPQGAAAGTGTDAAAIERFLVDLVVDQTGYSPDVVDLDADLEGDLGIDSIKQAQLLGEVQQQFDLTNIAAQRTALSSFPTLRSILNFLTEALAAPSAPAPPADLAPIAAGGPAQEALPSRPQPANGHLVLGVDPDDDVPDDWQELFTLSEQAEPAAEEAWRRGHERGRRDRQLIRAALRLLVDRGELASEIVIGEPIPNELAGLAAGAGVPVASVCRARARFRRGKRAPADKPSLSGFGDDGETGRAARTSRDVDLPNSSNPREMPDSPELLPGESMRFLLRMAPAPRRTGKASTPKLSGPALVIGQNPLADAICERVEQAGWACHVVPEVAALAELDGWLKKLWAKELTPHLFIASSHDADALREVSAACWQPRRRAALEVPYRTCQLWMQRMIDAEKMDIASVVCATNLGGDFGFRGASAVSPEGGLAGLVKAMLIEGWMRGFRETPMKVIDIAPGTTPRQAVEGIFRELAVPSYDMEVALHGEERWAVQPVYTPLAAGGQNGAPAKSQIRRGGVWVVTGGARGITAVVARELALRHQLKLHLLGTAPTPELTDSMRRAGKADRLKLRREVMAQAAQRNENSMEAWRNVEKAIEIDATLALLRESGLQAATYHSCDVSDLDALRVALDRVREQDGPIDGVIHGAGIGQDARFDRKRPDKVDQCLRAKIDGCINLMDATWQDPLEWFVAFGSISGRFGANGHTDYSLANDFMAKIMDRYRAERPDVNGVAFHWHAWGDIGMATKPETKLALEMINLEFMPAQEGIAHFLNELEQGGQEPEVLITDRSYYRKLFPVDRAPKLELEAPAFPLLDPEGDRQPDAQSPYAVELNPEREKFLSQHLVAGKPTLPFVVALEMMAEAARLTAHAHEVLEARHVEALQAIKWSAEGPMTIQVSAEPAKEGAVNCTVTADVRRRDGRLVTRNKTFFKGEFHVGGERPAQQESRGDLSRLEWTKINYLGPDAAIYHGPELQGLQRIAFDGDMAYGLISASSTVQLGGGQRPTAGWSVNCAAMDACLYAAALAAGKRFQKASLPVRFERIVFGRLPDPGEPCMVEVCIVRELESGLLMAFQLTGQNGDLLLDVDGYQVGWLS